MIDQIRMNILTIIFFLQQPTCNVLHS